MADLDVKKIVCGSCGSEFEDTLSKCPYCGSMNYKGAEAEYLGKLEGMRQDMQQLEKVPEQELKSKIKKKQKFVLRILVGLVLVVAVVVAIRLKESNIPQRDAKADYQWQKENFPIMDQMYREKDFDDLAEFYEEAILEDKPAANWEHSAIFTALMISKEITTYLEQEKNGETLYEYQQVELVCDYWILKGLDYGGSMMTDAEKETIRPYVEAARNSLEGRFTFTEEEKKKFTDSLLNNYGYPKYEDCEEYVKSHKN